MKKSEGRLQRDSAGRLSQIQELEAGRELIICWFNPSAFVCWTASHWCSESSSSLQLVSNNWTANKYIFSFVWTHGSILNDCLESHTRDLWAKSTALPMSWKYCHSDKGTFWNIAKNFKIWILMTFLLWRAVIKDLAFWDVFCFSNHRTQFFNKQSFSVIFYCILIAISIYSKHFLCMYHVLALRPRHWAYSNTPKEQ